MDERTRGVLIGILAVIVLAGCFGLLRLAVWAFQALQAMGKYG